MNETPLEQPETPLHSTPVPSYSEDSDSLHPLPSLPPELPPLQVPHTSPEEHFATQLIPASPNPAVHYSIPAVLSLILSLLGLVFLVSLPFGIALGIYALVSIGKSNGNLRGRAFAIAGIAISAVYMVIILCIIVFGLIAFSRFLH